MNAMQRKACEYVRNTGGNATLPHFLDDHDPVGQHVWDSLLADKLVFIDSAGHIHLTLVGSNALLVLR